MYKLLHIHHEIIFAWDTLKFVDPRFENEIIYIGESDAGKNENLARVGIPYKVYENTLDNITQIAKYAKGFDGVVFYCLEDVKANILLQLDPKIKTLTRFFGFELYNLCMDQYLSDRTHEVLPQEESTPSSLRSFLGATKRKLKQRFRKDYALNLTNQKSIYERLDAIFVINKFEYNELKEIFYLPKLIELKFTNHENELDEFKVISEKSNRIIVGNNGAEVNNHIDIFDIIKSSSIKDEVEFDLFFSYGNSRPYSKVVRDLAKDINQVRLIEDFLPKEEFEAIYESSAALVINSYRQNALGNIFTAIKVGCKIYLNKRSSTYHWLIAEGFNISKVEDLKADLESGNIKLSAEQQQRNIECFINAIKSYSVQDLLDKVINTLND